MSSSPSSIGRRVLFGFATLVLLCLIVAAQSLVPDETLATEPVSYSGEVGETVDAEQFTVKVTQLRFAKAVSDEDGFGSSGALKAKGVWVVATAEMTSVQAPLPQIAAELAMGDGYVYSASNWLSNGLAGGAGTTLNPGVTTVGTFAFEVPKDRLKDPVLQVSARQSIDDRLSARADIDLALSEAELDEHLAKPKEQIAVPEPTETS